MGPGERPPRGRITNRYIVVEGPIGVGKTSLSRRLAEEFNAELVLEKPEDNPFLERFYGDRQRYALPTQISFLFQRTRQLRALKQSDLFASTRVVDFLLEKDAMFARVNLDDDEFDLYRQIYNQLSIDIPKPDLVIYLQAPLDVLLDRVQRRGIEYEQKLDGEYLKQLMDTYTEFFHRFTTAPLLIINAAEINFVDNTDDFQTLVAQIERTHSGRHYFNPLTTAERS